MLDWNFIMDVLRATGFGSKWLSWIQAVLFGRKSK